MSVREVSQKTRRAVTAQPLFTTPEAVLSYLTQRYANIEAPWERRLRLALRYSTPAIDIGAAFADHAHLALEYPLSNRSSGRKRRRTKKIPFTPWYQRF